MGTETIKRVLLIAYHFPPVAGSSGVLRTLKFARYLPEFGWRPSVLTVHPRAYERLSDSQLAQVSRDVPVVRAFALDAARHMALAGRYPRCFALPDRWVSWLLGAVPAGLKMVREQRPLVLWSTYPMPTAHLVGLFLHRLTGLPWIADCRDSMLDDTYPADPLKRRIHAWIERRVVHSAKRIVFTTPGTLRMYAERYPEVPKDRWVLIANGYDEEDFCEQLNATVVPDGFSGKQTLLHSGLIDPVDRDPRPFLTALSRLKQSGGIKPQELRVVFRASGLDDELRSWIHALEIDDVVETAPPLPYHEALAEMREATALLLLQGACCNHQIPAKLYEYLRVGRPIVGLTDAEGDSAALLRELAADTILPLDDETVIMATLPDVLMKLQAGCLPIAADEAVALHSRRSRTAELALLLDQVILEVGS
ncbi:MAG: glycosyltransferase [Candidatus Polarisedimenticolaceae bacterium]|nr:glycosyltransferase [Candidatus Polarisedimenticolaceae bacterium]